MSAQTPGCGSNSEARKRAADRLATDTAASEGVASTEPGCTCGGLAACQQCQDRDARMAALSEEAIREPTLAEYELTERILAATAPVAVEGVETVEALTPDQWRRFTEAAERGLAPRRAILLLASHATNHRKHPHGDTCESCGSHWPCQIVRRAASPALRAVENLTPLSPVEPETSEPEGGESRG